MLINRKVKFKIIWNIFKSHSLLKCVVFYDVRTCGVDYSVNVIRNKRDGGVDKNPKSAKNHSNSAKNTATKIFICHCYS